MSVYIDFLIKAFRKQYAYRANSYIKMFGALVSIFISINIWLALYKDNISVKGIYLSDMINFTIINALILSISSANIGRFIAEKVKDGSIIVDFIRPVNFKCYVFAEQIGQNCYHFIFGTIVPCMVISIIYGFNLPKSPILFSYFICAFVFGIFLNFQIEYVLGLLAFWFKTSFYIDWFLGAFKTLFAGSFVPLWFYPELLYKISLFMPFRFVSFEPISLYLGKIPQGSETNIILVQTVWLMLLIVLEKIMWIRIQKKVVIHGG
jgi:ABC-2 type transport system permease protein